MMWPEVRVQPETYHFCSQEVCDEKVWQQQPVLLPVRLVADAAMQAGARVEEHDVEHPYKLANYSAHVNVV